MVGLTWCNDTEGNAGGSVATGRSSYDGSVKGDDLDKKGHTGPPGGGLGRGANNLTSVKQSLILEKCKDGHGMSISK